MLLVCDSVAYFFALHHLHTRAAITGSFVGLHWESKHSIDLHSAWEVASSTAGRAAVR